MKNTVVLRGGMLIDGTGNQPLKQSAAIVEGSEITAIGTTENIDVPDEAKVIDTSGMTVMPGLIDLHVHLCAVPHAGPGATSPPKVSIPETTLTLWGARHAELDLQAGFTTVRDAFSFHNDTGALSLRDATATGLVTGPRVFAAGYAGMTASIVDMRLPSHFDRPYGYTADGPWELRKRTREILRDGFDWIKTFTSGGRSPGQQEEDVWYVNHTLEELKAIIDEAHTFDRKVMIHATTPEAIRLAVEAGADTIEHGWPLNDDIIELMLERGTFLVPTISVYSERGFLRDSVAEPLRNRAERQFEIRMESFRKAYDAGVKIATGSDIAPSLPTMPHGDNAFELTMMVRHGMTSMDAIVASTTRAAEALGIESRLGALQPGKIADILVVHGDPLARIEDIEDGVAYVFKEGELLVDNVSGQTEVG